MREYAMIKKTISLVIAGAFLLAAQPFLWAQPGQKGSLAGYVYQSDGTTPAKGAVVKLRNLSSGAVFTSDKASELGYFKIDAVDKGLYVFGAMTDQGNFNATDIIGIQPNTTTKLSVALNVNSGGQANVQQPTKPDEPPVIRGEKFLGRVVDFNPSTLEARVFVEKGECNLGDIIHVLGQKEKGSETNFYQNANTIKQNGADQKKAIAGQYYQFPLEKPAIIQDWVYLKEKAGVAAFFLTPIGVLTIIGGTTTIVYIIDPPPVSVHKQ